MNRIQFLQASGALLAGAAIAPLSAAGAETAQPKFKLNLNLYQIGVKANPFEAIQLALDYGYGAITPDVGAMAAYPEEELQRLVAEMKAAGLAWGACGIQPFFEPDDEKFAAMAKSIESTAKTCQKAGVNRSFTWMMSSDNAMTYRQHFDLCARRIREVGQILEDNGMRLGLEYLGTAALLIKEKYPFLRTSREAYELIDATGRGNVGLALDAWHWFHAGETEADILKMTNDSIVTADICDAPAGVLRDQMPDSPRTLPCATGVIDVAAFLNGLIKVGYDGPLGMEPFDNSLSKLSTAEAMKKSTDAMKKAMALI